MLTEAEFMRKRDFELDFTNAPYLYIRMLISFFRPDDKEDIHEKMKISNTEPEVMKSVGTRLGFDKTVIFRKLLDIFAVK